MPFCLATCRLERGVKCVVHALERDFKCDVQEMHMEDVECDVQDIHMADVECAMEGMHFKDV